MADEVFIFCDRHPGRKVPIATFLHSEAVGWYEKMPRRDGPSIMTTLTDDAPVQRGGARIRWEFRCDCGTTVPARREKLIPVLDTLAANGIAHISLAGLAASL
ncbi:hypothetical protein [Mycobacterium sp. E740]|uniref:hypothetical protein n=1 Tax=Mycobacterium sp. E740 TaxID=1834149 RepID=UPI0007FF97A3|nr:hypothetical protein [Mycobacterium sp. E740]OBI83974.1 hypothetical protein A5663_12145 [Mycobacterium sp. E740]